ncbi:LOW QUALITY PROTEIN: exosome component 10-like [Limulus polyphemus]|uniref:LOW QUALITY PROTEIN: exosome component 10-like n=1 Tax=Limulus polyphemus TaxID=6850 RepID=A0ABM1BAJ5_LIMPO|nr:LOW QUALITY PROTEIN: exosome component 10-like [Limulus polyphemus]
MASDTSNSTIISDLNTNKPTGNNGAGNLLSKHKYEEDKKESFFEFLPGFKDVGEFSQNALRSALIAIKESYRLPTPGDDYDYYSSYGSFRRLMNAEGKCILNTMSSLLVHQGGKIMNDNLELDDKFDILVDSNDVILERVGTALDEASGLRKKQEELVIATVNGSSKINTSWNQNRNKYSRSVSSPGTFRLLTAKNIQRPQLIFKDKIDNSRSPFIPIIKEKPNSLKPLAILPEKLNDIEEYSHPYEVELDHFHPDSEQLEEKIPQVPKAIKETLFVYVDKILALEELCRELKQQKEIAVDLEHHSYRSFQGFTCLIQLSTREKDYIIDAIELRSELFQLNEIFTDPKIVKVLHGADMDILWLQRDFGLYVVNMFDTGQAARVLNMACYSLAYLLKHYCHVDVNKQFQLADWRIRPLPDDMIHYAREDTHYLLYIYDQMKRELISKGNDQKNLLISVFQRSKTVCLRKYQKPPFRDDSYLDLLKKHKKSFNNCQLWALKQLYEWRDKISRVEDESTGYVLPNHMLLQIAEVLPREQQGILACCNPIPPLVRQHLNELHMIIMRARDQPMVKPEYAEVHLKTPSDEEHVDTNNVLYCPHDMLPHLEEDHAPALFDDLITEDGSLNTYLLDDVAPENRCFKASFKYSPATTKHKTSATLFNWISKEDSDLKSTSRKKEGKKYNIGGIKTLITPFERYLMVKNISSTKETSPTEINNEERVKRLQAHFRDVVLKGNQAAVEPTKEQFTVKDPDIQVDNQTTKVGSNNNNKDTTEEDLPLRHQVMSKLSKTRKKRKTEAISDIRIAESSFVKSTTGRELSQSVFQTFDYSETDMVVFKGQSISKKNRKEFNPDDENFAHKRVNQRGRKRKEGKSLTYQKGGSSQGSSNNCQWPRR